MIGKFGYIIENRYICSVINERLHVFDKLKTALAGRVNNSKQIMEKWMLMLHAIGGRKGGGGLLGRYSFDAVVTCSLWGM